MLQKIKIITILIIVLASFIYGEIGHAGLRNEVVIGDSRLDDQLLLTKSDDGLMPEIVVTAPRIKLNNIDDETSVANQNYRQFREKLVLVDKNDRNKQTDYLLAKIRVETERDSRKVSSLIINQGDTIKEDLQFSGKSGEISGVLDGDLAVIGGDLQIKQTGKVRGDIAVMGGDIVNFGTIERDLAIFGGSFHNKGILEGYIFVAGGNVKLDSGSAINGDVAIIGGTIEKDTFAVIGGEVKALEIKALGKTLPKFAHLLQMSRRMPRPMNIVFRSLGTIFSIVGFLVLTLLVVLIFPKALTSISNKVEQNVWFPILFGIVIQILIVPLVVLFTISIIGIPIIPLFLLAIVSGLVVGFSSICYLIGKRILKNTNEYIGNIIGAFVLGFVVIMALNLVGQVICLFTPIGRIFTILGGVIVYVTMTIGLGGAFYTLISRRKIKST